MTEAEETMKVQLYIRAHNLKNVAGAFKGTSDPFAVVTVLGNNRSAKPEVLGKTEVMKNTLNPDWTTTFEVDYELGEPKNILVKVFDEVRKGDNKPMGSAQFCVGSVLGAKGNTKAKKLAGGNGTLFVRAQKAKDYGSLKLKMSGVKIANTDGFFGKSDPYYQITKKVEGLRGSEYDVVHRSEVIKNNLNPNWKSEMIDLRTLCDGDLDMILKLDVYDYESDGKNELIGGIETSINGLINAKGRGGFDITSKKGKQKGTLKIHQAEVVGGDDAYARATTATATAPAPSAPPIGMMANMNIAPNSSASRPTAPKPSFTDFMSGGCEMSLCVAIDFTGSNGDPRKPGTLHYMGDEHTMNDYEKAISSIGSILANYDHDKKYPVYGFGAKYNGVVQHCFQCGTNSEVDGIDGIIGAYKQTFKSGLVMSGPTVFTEVLQTAAAFAVSGQENAARNGMQNYTTLLILSDGAVSDLAATAQCLNSIKNAPLSVVIVGIGGADFGSMTFLDDQASDIDIAQFVEFNKHKHDANSLTRATLDEIPTQLENYYHRNGIMPNPPVQVEEEEIVIEPEEEEIDLTIDFGADGNTMAVPSGQTGGVYVPQGAW